jgi:hypothetical protein
LGDWASVATAISLVDWRDHEDAVCRQQNGQRWENPRRSYEASGNGMILDSRARQLPDESVVMRYPTREYQTDQPSVSRPFCSPHTVSFFAPPPRSGSGSEPSGVPGGARPRSLQLAHRPHYGRRGPARLRSLSATLTRQGQAPAGRPSLGHPPCTPCGSPPTRSAACHTNR